MIMAVLLAWVYITPHCFRRLGGHAYALSLTGPSCARAPGRSRSDEGTNRFRLTTCLLGWEYSLNFFITDAC